jgi:hypothetical protein
MVASVGADPNVIRLLIADSELIGRIGRQIGVYLCFRLHLSKGTAAAGKTTAPGFCRGSPFILSGVTTEEITAFAWRSEVYWLVKVQFLSNLANSDPAT